METNTAETLTKCTTCCRLVGAPYRRSINGKIVEGCIDESHTGHVFGSSAEWHNSPTARTIRRDTAARLSAMLGQPMRGYGLPGKLKLTGSNRPVK